MYFLHSEPVSDFVFFPSLKSMEALATGDMEICIAETVVCMSVWFKHAPSTS